MPTESAFLLAGLFLLLVAAGWATGRFSERDDEDTPPPLNIDYLKGLNFLLNEQTDQALEHFLHMVRVDDKTTIAENIRTISNPRPIRLRIVNS